MKGYKKVKLLEYNKSTSRMPTKLYSNSSSRSDSDYDRALKTQNQRKKVHRKRNLLSKKYILDKNNEDLCSLLDKKQYQFYSAKENK